MKPETFKRGMARLSILFLPEKRIGTDLYLIYQQALADVTDQQFMRAVRYFEQATKFMPKPGEIREYLRLEPQPTEPREPYVPPTVHAMPLPDFLKLVREGADFPEELQRQLIEQGGPTDFKTTTPPEMKKLPAMSQKDWAQARDNLMKAAQEEHEEEKP